MATLHAPVGGRRVSGFSKDVQAVQGALNRFPAHYGGPERWLETDGHCGSVTIRAIQTFQRRIGFLRPDGRVDPNARTYKALAGGPSRIPGAFTTYLVPNVPLIPQTMENSCWYAAAQMVIQWKRRQTMSTLIGHADPSELSQMAEEHRADQKLPYEHDALIARALGLVPVPASSLGINSIRELLQRYGPLWTGGRDHAFVVVGANERLDQIYIHDPSPRGHGRAMWFSWTRWFMNGSGASSIGDNPTFDILLMYHP